MAKTKSYFEERNILYTEKLQEYLLLLPRFCYDFFIGIEMNTSVLTRVNYASDLRIFFDFLLARVPYFQSFSNMRALDISDMENVTQSHLEAFMSYLSYYKGSDDVYIKNDERAKSRKMSAVRSLFKYFYNKNALSQNVSAKINMPKLHEKSIVRLDSEEVCDIISLIEKENLLSDRQSNYNYNNTRERDLAIITLLLGTGIRVSECVGLNVNDVDLERNTFVVTRKGGNQARLFFSDEVAEVLRQYVAIREKKLAELGIKNEPALFLSLQNHRIGVRSVQILVQKYAKIITPLKKITPHKLRSTFGTQLYRDTKDIYVVAEVLGHKDINTTKKHYAATGEDIRRAALTAVKLKRNENDDDD